MKKLLYILLSALGFSACGEDGLIGGSEEPCMYGTPTVDFMVKGKVTDNAGVPIKGIVVSSKGMESFTDGNGLSAVTAEDGTFVTNKATAISIGGTLLFTDTDGEANGGDFATVEVDVRQLPKSQTKPKDGWYTGEFEVTADIKLEKK